MEGGSSAQREAAELLQEFEQRRGEAAQLAAEAQQALTELQNEAASRHGALEGALSTVEAGVASLKAIDEAQDALTDGLEGVGQAMADLDARFREGISAAEAARADAVAALDSVESNASAGQEKLATAVEAVGTACESLRGAATEARSSVDAGLGGLRDTMNDLLERARARVGEVMSEVSGLVSAHESVMDEQGGTLRDGVDAVLTDMRSRIESELGARLEASAAAVVDALGELERQVAEASERSREGREAAEPQFGVASESVDPLQTAIEHVRSAAEQMGLSW
jgi:hypothetical protein